MSERTSYARDPCWVDLGSPTWTPPSSSTGPVRLAGAGERNVEQTGGYRRRPRTARCRRMMPLMQEASRRLEQLRRGRRRRRHRGGGQGGGGSVLAEPMDVMELGGWRYSPTERCRLRDLAAGTLPVPASSTSRALVWNELNTRDVEGAKAFYAPSSAGASKR